jgi:heme-degrading monooxygenase HmoA
LSLRGLDAIVGGHHARHLENVDASEHQVAKRKGREIWYSHYMIRICKVERAYGRPDI